MAVGKRDLYQVNTQKQPNGRGEWRRSCLLMLGHKKGRNDKKLGGAHRCHPLGPAKWHFTVGKGVFSQLRQTLITGSHLELRKGSFHRTRSFL